MKRVVVVGGGWSGCGAAEGAAKFDDTEVFLIERTDNLLGVGRQGGHNAMNGRFTIMLEAKALGGNEIFSAVESTITHWVDLPHAKHGYLYNNFKAETAVYKKLKEMGVNVVFERYVKDVVMEDEKIKAVKLNNGDVIEADAFVDATGGAGPEALCKEHGRGCVLCSLRCPQYGPRVSVSALTGVKESMAKRPDGKLGGMSNACTVIRESVSKEFLEEIEKNNGYVRIPAPEGLVDEEYGYERLRQIRTQQHLSKESHEQYLVCVDVGTIKFLSRPYVRTSALRKIPAFENAQFFEPLAGGKGNSIRFLAITPRENSLQVKERPNLFCAGEKVGLVGIMDATVTGLLAGNNAARVALGKPIIELPRETALGEGLAWVNEEIDKKENEFKKYSYLGAGGLWDRIIERDLFTLDKSVVQERMEKLGLIDAFKK